MDTIRGKGQRARCARPEQWQECQHEASKGNATNHRPYQGFDHRGRARREDNRQHATRAEQKHGGGNTNPRNGPKSHQLQRNFVDHTEIMHQVNGINE